MKKNRAKEKINKSISEFDSSNFDYLFASWAIMERNILFGRQSRKETKKWLQEIIDKNSLEIKYEKDEIFLYRARKILVKDTCRIDPFWGYSQDKCLGPSREITQSGRCNCEHYPMLYVAKDEYTALAEIRPAKRENVSIAKIRLNEKIKLLNFKDVNELLDVENSDSRDLYISLESNFYHVRQQVDDYLISQFMSICAIEMGYDGIQYRSSLSESGINLVIFNEKKVEAISSKLYQVHSALYYVEEHMPRKQPNRLLPIKIRKIFKAAEIEAFIDRIRDPLF